MTRDDLKTVIRANLGEAGSNFYSDDDIEYQIQASYEDCVARFYLLRSSTSITVPAGTNFVSLAGVSDYDTAFAFYDPLRKLWIKSSIRWPLGFKSLSPKWIKFQSPPEYWDHVDDDTVVFYGHPSANYSLTMHYFAKAPTLSGNTHFNVPPQLLPYIEHLCYAELHESFEEYEKAMIHFEAAEKIADQNKVNAQTIALLTRGGFVK